MLPPSPLDPDAGPRLIAPWETDDASPIATSSPRRVEDAPPARWRGPTQTSANSRVTAHTRPLTDELPGQVVKPHARVADARSSVGAGLGGNPLPSQGVEAGTEGSATTSPARVSDARDPAGAIWRDGAFRGDAWVRAVDGEPLPIRP